MLPVSVVPSFPAPSWSALEAVLEQLVGVSPGFQVDIVDGQFVPHTSWPFMDAQPMRALALLASYSEKYVLEIDCMVQEPLQYLDAIAATGAKRVIVHVGSMVAIAPILAHASTHGYQLGIAATADIPLSDITALIPDVSFVQLMGIAAVGQQGQPFDARTLARARELRLHYPDLEIAVDGAVNRETIPLLYAAGVNRFAPGSAITKASDPVGAYRALRAIVNG
jgi:ribulose-phosphate 3-epimerase